MGLGTRVGRVFLAYIFKCTTGGKNLYIQKIVADESDDFAIGIERIFTKHRAACESFLMSEAFENIVHRFLLGAHTYIIRLGEVQKLDVRFYFVYNKRSGVQYACHTSNYLKAPLSRRSQGIVRNDQSE